MRKYIVIRFDNIVDGVNFMLTYEYPCSFIVDSIIYDKNGDSTLFENYIEMLIEDIRDVLTDNFIESVICYDGDNLFIDKIV